MELRQNQNYAYQLKRLMNVKTRMEEATVKQNYTLEGVYSAHETLVLLVMTQKYR